MDRAVGEAALAARSAAAGRSSRAQTFDTPQNAIYNQITKGVHLCSLLSQCRVGVLRPPRAWLPSPRPPATTRPASCQPRCGSSLGVGLLPIRAGPDDLWFHHRRCHRSERGGRSERANNRCKPGHRFYAASTDCGHRRVSRFPTWFPARIVCASRARVSMLRRSKVYCSTPITWSRWTCS